VKELKRWKQFVASAVVEGDGNVEDPKIVNGLDDILSEILTRGASISNLDEEKLYFFSGQFCRMYYEDRIPDPGKEKK
jgi:hypothetical protein